MFKFDHFRKLEQETCNILPYHVCFMVSLAAIAMPVCFIQETLGAFYGHEFSVDT